MADADSKADGAAIEPISGSRKVTPTRVSPLTDVTSSRFNTPSGSPRTAKVTTPTQQDSEATMDTHTHVSANPISEAVIKEEEAEHDIPQLTKAESIDALMDAIKYDFNDDSYLWCQGLQPSSYV